jgi:hypothetical protein
MHNGEVTNGPSPDLETEHAKFHSDVEAVRRYGEIHPDEYVDEFFENEPHIRLIVLIAGDNLATHEVELRRLVKHPTQFEARLTPFFRTRLDEIRQEVLGVVANQPGAVIRIAMVRGLIHIVLAADQEKLAAQFLAQFGDAVELRVGNFSYPPLEDSINDGISSRRVEGAKLPLLPTGEFALALEDDIRVSSGGKAHGVLRFSNLSGTEVIIDTNGTLTAQVIDPRTGKGVGGFSSFQAMPLCKFVVPPGGTVTIPVLVGTTSSIWSLGYAIPAGNWEIEVPIKIEDRGTFRSLPLPIQIGPSQQNF